MGSQVWGRVSNLGERRGLDLPQHLRHRTKRMCPACRVLDSKAAPLHDADVLSRSSLTTAPLVLPYAPE